MIEIPIRLLSEDAKMPTKARDSDAGFDLYSIEDLSILPGQIVKHDIKIAGAIPDGYFGLICDRSGHGSKGLKVFGGVWDSSYRGSVSVCLGYLNTLSFIQQCYSYVEHFIGKLIFTQPTDKIELPKGSKIAQLVVIPIPLVKLTQVDELDETDRGEKGFGSSGQ
jgi:dUTP pyrophosphatase